MRIYLLGELTRGAELRDSLSIAHHPDLKVDLQYFFGSKPTDRQSRCKSEASIFFRLKWHPDRDFFRELLNGAIREPTERKQERTRRGVAIR